jgi:hypothetical protein
VLDATPASAAVTDDGELSRFLRERDGRSYREVLLDVIGHAVRTLEALARWEDYEGMTDRVAHRRSSVATSKGSPGILR